MDLLFMTLNILILRYSHKRYIYKSIFLINEHDIECQTMPQEPEYNDSTL